MKVLLAEDDPLFLRGLMASVARWGYEPQAVADGLAAWKVLEREDGPRLAILDRIMPGLDGVEVCRRVRDKHQADPRYLILLTGHGGTQELVSGLEGGADDYITKPADPEEIHARLNVGRRVVELQQSLVKRMAELEQALAHVRELQRLLPICMYCKRVRTDEDHWQQIEAYIRAHVNVEFSHGICPHCYESVVKQDVERVLSKTNPQPPHAARARGHDA